MPLVDHVASSKFGTLQSLDDAIAFRSSRLQRPCLDCTGRYRCTEHALDQYLLKAYQARYAGAQAEALAEIDPASIGNLTAPACVRPSPRACAKPLPATQP